VADRLTHLDDRGRVRMVDVGAKPSTHRIAVARAQVRMKSSTVALIAGGKVAKGNVFETARIAGIMAAKRTSSLVPLTHPIALTHVAVDFVVRGRLVEIEARAECHGPTGVEMEAMAAATVAALTIYDMCKAVDRGMMIESVALIRKEGGKSGTYVRGSAAPARKGDRRMAARRKRGE